jgi:3'-phosphoadenosine 5'-phosphosulfate sulfotransferase (PAPS reductase)/FAD synthetase
MPELRVLSLGWGVQSFTLAAMSALGELPKLDVLIHADTSWERQATYEFAAKWQPWLESKGMLVVSASSLSARRPQVNKTNIMSRLIIEMKEVNPDKLNRQCTGAWKIFIVKQLIRQEMAIRGIKLGSEVVEQWLGISWDEAPGQEAHRINI